jgi:phage shock protein A
MIDPKENRKARVEMISKSHHEGDIQTIAKAVVNLYDHMEELERKLNQARQKINELQARLDDQGG